VFNNSFPFTVSLPLPLPFIGCLPLPYPLPFLCTLRFPGPCLTALRVVLTFAVVLVSAIARAAPSTARRSRIRPVVIIICFLDYLIPLQWSNGQKVGWLVLPAAWWLNLCAEIIATVPRETLTGVFNLP
jgi:hypothetical protein